VLTTGTPGISGSQGEPISDGLTADAGGAGAEVADRGGITDGVSSHGLSLWIDLVRQVGSVAPSAPEPTASGLTRQQLSALGCLQAEGLTVRVLARSLRISSAAATLIADSLTRVGAAVRHGDRLDRRLVRLVATGAGVRMASDHRRSQVAALERLLDQMEPRWLAVLLLAVKELAGAVSSPRCASLGNMLAPEPQQRTLH
jgi:DNA-binding MarR family transcriptional regulator